MNYLIIHGGGPTPVINASLYGVIQTLKQDIKLRNIYGANGGIEAIFSGNYVDLYNLDHQNLENLLITPGSFLGSSRYPLNKDDYKKIALQLKKQNINGVFLNGGNGTMNTCSKLADACKPYNINVIGIPKTIDNDISMIDHSPGYGSAAYYIASTVSEIIQDVKSLPIHVSIIEVMGRNAGWLAASAALSGNNPETRPDYIYTSDIPFSEEKFLEDIKSRWAQKKGLVVVVSEGLHSEDGIPIAPLIYRSNRSEYFGDVGTHLANLIIKELGIKARSEKPGLAGRADIQKRSQVDLKEAIEVGRVAANAMLNDMTNFMVGIERDNNDSYSVTYPLIPLADSIIEERKMPKSFINSHGNNITEEYIKWARELVSFDPPHYADFQALLKI